MPLRSRSPCISRSIEYSPPSPSSSSLSSFPLVRYRWKTLKIRVISGGREETPFSSPVSSSCSNRCRRRLLRLSIEAFRTWTGYMVDFPGVLRCATALRLRILRNHPRLPSLRQAGPSSKCAGHPLLFEEGISQSNTQDAQFLSDYLSFHGETALRKGARQLLPAAKMISQLHMHSHIREIEAQRLNISDGSIVLYNQNISIFSRMIPNLFSQIS